MCIAIYKPAGQVLTKERLSICNANNPDGAGFAYVKDGQLHVEKGYFDFENFWNDFEKIQNYQCLVHFRIGTAGNKDGENCHPWQVSENLAIIHNGTICDFQDTKSPISDTGLFTDKILKELINLIGPKFFLAPVIHYLMLKTIGDSRMVFLDNDGDFTIINEGKGVVENEIWYSNESFRVLKTESKNKADIKDNTAFSNTHGKKGKRILKYILAGGDGSFLSSREINHFTTKRYRLKLKKLVEKGIVFELVVDKNGDPIPNQQGVQSQKAYDIWLSAQPKKPVILEAEIVPDYAG